jgi:hypothetical protein
MKKPEKKPPDYDNHVFGKEVFERIQTIGTAMRSLNQNYAFLVTAFGIYFSNLGPNKDKEKFKLSVCKSLGNYSCCLVNYVSFFGAFVDQMISFRNYLKNIQIEKDYKEKLSELNLVELTAFLCDLRNYALHYKMPLVGTGVTLYYDKDALGKMMEDPTLITIESDVSLRTSELLKWKKWTKQSIEFLMKNEERVYLSKYLHSCHQHIVLFGAWFVKTVGNSYKKEILNYLSSPEYKAKERY